MPVRALAAVILLGLITGLVAVTLPWDVPFTLWNARRVSLTVGEQRLNVVLNPGNGMVGVPTLGALDGMLFSTSRPVEPGTGGFQMAGMDRALDIVFFDPHGRATQTMRMEPCDAGPCPVYAPESTYLWAIESEVGTLRVSEGDLLRLGP